MSRLLDQVIARQISTEPMRALTPEEAAEGIRQESGWASATESSYAVGRIVLRFCASHQDCIRDAQPLLDVLRSTMACDLNLPIAPILAKLYSAIPELVAAVP